MADEDTQPKGLMDEDGRIKSRVTLDQREKTTGIELDMFRLVGPAMAMVVACVAMAYLVPSLEFARPWKPGDPVPFWNVLGRPFESEEEAAKEEKVAKVDEIAQQALAEAKEPEIKAETKVVEVAPGSRLPVYTPHEDDQKPVEQSVELFEGDELDIFFESLARSDESLAGATTRVIHWGDSAIGVDGIPSAIRKRMQARFGDAGHGYHVMAPPNTSYRHKGVKFSHNEEWELCFIIQNCRKDGRYGLGGVTTHSYGGGKSTFAPDPKHSSGHVSRFTMHYLGDPKGGRVRLRVDREEPVIVDTETEELGDKWHTLQMEDGPHRISVEALGGGKARIYGVTLEREVPGVVWDGMALVGAFTKRMLNFEPEHLKAQLGHRQPQLAVFMFGGNDMIRDSMTMEDYENEYRQVIQMMKTARPEMSCLIMAPLDHAVRKGVRIESLPVVAPMVEAQRAAAKAEGCAFFDTYMAMGGDGSAGRWRKQDPPLIGGDLSHVTASGQVVIGEMFYRALMQAYVAYRRRTDVK